MKKKKKFDDDNLNNITCKYTMKINHTFGFNISTILNTLGKTSKYTFNHYLFCHKFFLLYKDLVFEDIYFNTIKTKKFLCEDINILIKHTFNKFYLLYQTDFKTYISNNNILYSHIKKLNIDINNENFIIIYNKLIVDCLSLDKLDISNANLLYLYEKNIYSILNSYYCWKYFNVKNGLINKKPIKATFDNKFKNHVMETDNPDIFIKPNITYENINMLVQEPNKQIITQMNIVARICYSNIKYEITSSNIVVNSIKKAQESINSYYSLKKKGMKANKPKYLESNFYSLIFCGNGKKIKTNSIQLFYGKIIYKNQIKYFNKLLDKKPELFIKKPSLMNNSNYKLGQIEIKKLYNRTYKVLYTFDKTIKPVKEIPSVKLSETISIDLGLQNLMMIHDPSGKQIIVKGGYLISINEYYNKKIASVQSLRDIEKDKYKKEKLNNEILELLNQRERKLNGMMNKIITSLYTLYSKKKLIIIGYNEGWKQNINLRKDTNRKFYDIPYKKLISKMKYKFKEVAEINVINEAYTSKCDSLGNERIEKQEVYMGSRVKRGLFSSSVGKLINADLNGAINIMRKYSNEEYKNIKGINLCNPERLKITS